MGEPNWYQQWPARITRNQAILDRESFIARGLLKKYSGAEVTIEKVLDPDVINRTSERALREGKGFLAVNICLTDKSGERLYKVVSLAALDIEDWVIEEIISQVAKYN